MSRILNWPWLPWSFHPDPPSHTNQYRFSPISFVIHLQLGACSVNVSLVLSLPSGACFLISPNNALICWRWGLCSLETPQTVVPPKWLGSGWGGSWLGCCLNWSSWGCQSRRSRQRGLAPFLCLPGDLAALEERMEGWGPKAGFVPQWVKVIWGGSLAVEAESSTDQTVVAPPVIAAIAVKAWTGSRGGSRLARWAAGDAGRACSASGHPGQDHVNEGPQDQAHRHGHAESYDQRNCEERNINHISYILWCSM